jgi:hypothetical protein
MSRGGGFGVLIPAGNSRTAYQRFINPQLIRPPGQEKSGFGGN